jgi:hypothetical protein
MHLTLLQKKYPNYRFNHDIRNKDYFKLDIYEDDDDGEDYLVKSLIFKLDVIFKAICGYIDFAINDKCICPICCEKISGIKFNPISTCPACYKIYCSKCHSKISCCPFCRIR